MAKLLSAIGLMSGTSMDGVDVAHIHTDGEMQIEHGETRFYPYDDAMRALLSLAMRGAAMMDDRTTRTGILADAERKITEAHIAATESFLSETNLSASDIDIIGFHGQTVIHKPLQRLTVQIGDGDALAKASGIKVMADMRANDIAAGGQGAPLAPAYHRALAKGHDLPVCFVNIGGISNVTWIGRDDAMLAFDCGPGNALVDDWAERHTGKPFDEDGALATAGTVDDEIMHKLISHPFFSKPCPKSLDRSDFSIAEIEALSAEDGAATLTDFTARAIIHAEDWFSEMPVLWVICGGGRHNPELMRRLAYHAECAVAPAEGLGLNGDALEAEAWAYLATRASLNLPLSWPTTTGAPTALTGGVSYLP